MADSNYHNALRLQRKIHRRRVAACVKFALMNAPSRLLALCLLLSSGLPHLSSFADATNSVDRGLAWLASQQKDDGSWSSNTALDSITLLAFFSAGHVPGDKQFGPLLERGLQHVLTQQAPNGSFSADRAMMYGHGITTLLLAETSGMSKQDKPVRAALEKAVTLILRAQAVEKPDIHAGGWRYQPHSADSDLSVTVWQITALKAASEVGVAVPRRAMERALAYIKRCEHARGGFGYQPGGLPNQSRTAAAMIALRLCGLPDDEAIGRSRAWLMENPLRWPDPFFYSTAHHCAHAEAGFSEKLLVEHQNADGSWSAPADSPEEKKAGPLYCTAMAVLALTAKDHYLPVYLW